MKVRNIFKIKCVLLFILIVMVYKILTLSTCNRGLNGIAKIETMVLINKEISGINDRVIMNNFLDTLRINKKIDKSNYLYKDSLPVIGLNKYIVLVRKGKTCYIYKVPIDKLLKEREYKDSYLYKKGKMLFLIKGDYNSGKKCKFEDYEECNIYLTEKGVLEYKDDYECE